MPDETKVLTKEWRDFFALIGKTRLGLQAELGRAARLLVDSEVRRATVLQAPRRLRLSRADRARVAPCPHCGDPAVDLGFRAGLHWAFCRGCGTEFIGSPSVEGTTAEQALGWWNWRGGRPVVPDALAVDCAIGYLKRMTSMLSPAKGRSRKFPPANVLLTACLIVLGELRGIYTGPFGRRRFRVPPGPRRPDRVTGGGRVG